ncbi:unnamed protein product [Lampetra planeri]
MKEGKEKKIRLYRGGLPLRFEALPLDSRAWDLNFFVGGPVWSLDWGPTPNGSLSNQHVALYANSSALDLHKLNQIHREPALLQVPRMARMGLLAAAFSDGKVRVFSLPHAEDLPQAQLTDAEGDVPSASVALPTSSTE